KIDRRIAGDDMPELRVLGLEDGSDVLDLNRFGDGADFEGDVDTGALIDLQGDGIREQPLEARGLDRQCVLAGRQGRDIVNTRIVAGALPVTAGIDTADLHHRIGDDGAGTVFDGAGEATGDALREEREGEADKRESETTA